MAVMHISDDVKALLNCLGAPAILLGHDYRILMANAEYEAVYSDGRPLTKRHCYEVSHGNSVPCDMAGEHCPLKQCSETRQKARVLHVHHTPRGQEYVNVETWPVKDQDGEIMYFVEVLHPSTIASPAAGSGLIGKSPAFQRTLELVNRVAQTETTVLLLGETGTGKEVMARTIHERSKRSGGPFVPVECSGLPESLFESEMFGYVKGAFTGANANKAGLVEAAENGTLFLDEVGDISLAEQVKILRLLETRCFRRVGATEPLAADFRLVCATNKGLEQMVAEGTFRADLYYRLSVFDIELPPLRERREDLRPLAESILEKSGARLQLSDEALNSIEGYPFPGNIRELRNIMERAVLMCDGDTLLPEHFPAHCRVAEGAAPRSDPLDSVPTMEAVELEHLRRSLRNHTGDRKSLAKKLGISERALYRKLAKLRES